MKAHNMGRFPPLPSLRGCAIAPRRGAAEPYSTSHSFTYASDNAILNTFMKSQIMSHLLKAN